MVAAGVGVQSQPPLVLSGHLGGLSTADLTEVGSKGWGLLSLPLPWTKPFIIVTAATHAENLAEVSPSDTRRWLIEKFRQLKFGVSALESQGPLYVRSSAIDEGMDERGQFESVVAAATWESVANAVAECWKVNADRLAGRAMPVVIQGGAGTLLTGHLSNERRVSQRHDSWLYEVLANDGEVLDRGRFRPVQARDENRAVLLANDQNAVVQALRAVPLHPSPSLHARPGRRHYEWCWDGQRVWVLQCDFEASLPGERPNNRWSGGNVASVPSLTRFVDWQDASRKWRKVDCLAIFRECDLPTSPLYVMEEPSEIEAISTGRISDDIRSDLQALAELPVVIRTDVDRAASKDGLLLPRTDACKHPEDAERFLVATAADLMARGIRPDEICFLAHRFIPARSGAYSLAETGVRRVRVDGIWGVPDGLLFYPCDSFEVDASTGTITWAKRRCKYRYIDFDDSGEWFEKMAGTPWDWESSLLNEEVATIGEQDSMIAGHLNARVEVMHFVGVAPDSGLPSVLPWFLRILETEDLAAAERVVSPTRTAPLIRTLEELERVVADEERLNTLRKTGLRVSPDAEHIHDEEFVDQIAVLATRHGIPVELEGSVLSHVFYMLTKAGVAVRCVDPGEPPAVVGAQKFDKLVRDKLPNIIEDRGERTVVRRATQGELIDLLKEKLFEEAVELSAASIGSDLIEEASDVFEVLRALTAAVGYNEEDLLKMANTKREARGGFGAGYVLRGTYIRPIAGLESKDTSVLFAVEESINSEMAQASRRVSIESLAGEEGENSGAVLRAPWVGVRPSSDGPYEFSVEGIRLQATIRWRPGTIEVELSLPAPADDPNQLQLAIDEGLEGVERGPDPSEGS